MILDTEIAIGKSRSDSFGQVKFPNFKLLLDLAKRSELDQDIAETLIEVGSESIVRVSSESVGSIVFLLEVDEKWERIAQQNGDFLTLYKDESHKQVRGGGWTNWLNSDFEEPFTADLILSHLGWNRLMKYLRVSGRSIHDLTPMDELSACSE